MQVKTQSCVVAGKKTVAVTEQTIDWNNNGTLVQITRGGICGSDLHYYQEGKVGNFMIKAPMVLGHEVIGKVIHSDSSELHEGQTVAINPSKEGANKQVISSQADSLIKISRIWADFFPANTSNQPI